MSDIQRVVENAYCIGCGGCALQDPAITMGVSPLGLPQARLPQTADCDAVCPFAARKSEDDLSNELYSSELANDARIGRHIGTYAGGVRDEAFREKSSSGGMVTWILLQLLERGEIDGVIHVGRSAGSGYEYRISETAEDIIGNAKSRYYPVHFNEALSTVLDSGKSYAFVGVPCFVKAVRLLAGENARVRDVVKYCIAIFCGHMKSKSFSEMIALQQGVTPAALKYVDFRVKNRSAPANRYSNQVHFIDDGGALQSLPPVATKDLHGMDWGLGYFKAPPCDWCDDIAGEVADFSCGDAWLPEYVSDSLGTSVMISRNAVIDAILQDGRAKGVLALDDVDVGKIYESQAGNYRHRQEGLAVRMADAQRAGIWTPPKRIRADSFQVDARRRAIYRHRQRLMRRSHSAFQTVRNGNKYLIFMLKMMPYEIYYAILNRRLVRGTGKILLQFVKYFKVRYKK